MFLHQLLSFSVSPSSTEITFLVGNMQSLYITCCLTENLTFVYEIGSGFVWIDCMFEIWNMTDV